MAMGQAICHPIRRPRYWAIVGGTFVIPLQEMTKAEFEKLPELNDTSSVPVWFCREGEELLVWPVAESSIQIVQSVVPTNFTPL